MPSAILDHRGPTWRAATYKKMAGGGGEVASILLHGAPSAAWAADADVVIRAEAVVFGRSRARPACSCASFAG